MSWTEYNDPNSRAVFAAFKKGIEGTLSQIAPQWDMRHIKMRRRTNPDTHEEECEIRLVIRPKDAIDKSPQLPDAKTMLEYYRSTGQLK